MGKKAQVRFFEWADVRLDRSVEGINENLRRLLRFREVLGDFQGMAGTRWWWSGGLGAGRQERLYWRDSEVGARGGLKTD